MHIIRAIATVMGVLLTLTALGVQAGNVLVVLSDADHLDLKDGKTLETGFYLNELMQPLELLREAGHSITFATPKGSAPAVDAASLDKMYFGNDEAALKLHRKLLEQLNLLSPMTSPVVSLARVEQIGYDRFDAVYIPGGHAPMQDLLRSEELGKLLTHFHQHGKATALVCHGPIALISTLHDANEFVGQLERGVKNTSYPDWIYAGYKMTVISNREEVLARGLLNGGEMRFYPETALTLAGGRYVSNAEPWVEHMVVDRELITGQNPASAVAVANELVQRLQKSNKK